MASTTSWFPSTLPSRILRRWHSTAQPPACLRRACSTRRTRQPPAIDGDLSDWASQAGFTLDRSSAETLSGLTPEPADASATLRTAWTPTDLYLAIHIDDDVIVNDSSDVWRDDEVELAFYAVYDGNPAGGDTHQFTVNADGRVTDFGVPDPPIEAMAAIVPGGWDVEVRIPASTLYGFNNHLAAGERSRSTSASRRRRWRLLGQLPGLAGHGYDWRRRLRRDVPHCR